MERKFIADPERQREAIELSKKYDNASIFLNKVSEIVYKETSRFFEQISLFSAGTISLSVTAIMALARTENNTIDQYKYLFLIGIGFLIISLIIGVLYLQISSRSNFFSAKSNWGNRYLEYQEFIDKIPPVKQTVEEDLKTNIEKSQRKDKTLAKITAVISVICPILFVLGLILVSSYFLIQIFNF